MDPTMRIGALLVVALAAPGCLDNEAPLEVETGNFLLRGLLAENVTAAQLEELRGLVRSHDAQLEFEDERAFVARPLEEPECENLRRHLEHAPYVDELGACVQFDDADPGQ